MNKRYILSLITTADLLMSGSENLTILSSWRSDVEKVFDEYNIDQFNRLVRLKRLESMADLKRSDIEHIKGELCNLVQ